jgi:outer membrane receptor for ferrienterochelin and colicin
VKKFVKSSGVKSQERLQESVAMKRFGNPRRFLALIAGVFGPALSVFGQDITPTPQTTGQSVATAVEVIVTGSNIPTAEEVGPNPVDTYRRADIDRLGVRSATDFVQKLPTVTGVSINENVNTLGNGQTEIDLRGLGPKETLVLMDGVSRLTVLPITPSSSIPFPEAKSTSTCSRLG